MRDPHSTPLAAAPECPPEPGPLPCCPVCAGAPQRISWRQRPGQPVVLVFDPCGHRWSSPAPPVLAVTTPAEAREAREGREVREERKARQRPEGGRGLSGLRE